MSYTQEDLKAAFSAGNTNGYNNGYIEGFEAGFWSSSLDLNSGTNI